MNYRHAKTHRLPEKRKQSMSQARVWGKERQFPEGPKVKMTL